MLELEAFQLPQLTLTRTTGFNTFSYTAIEDLPRMEFIGIRSGFESETEKEEIEKEYEETFSSEIECSQDKHVCNICYIPYDLGKQRPLSLTCGHTVCAGCVKNMYKDRLVQCPFDKKCFHYEHMREIGQNYALMELIEEEHNKSLEACEDEAATNETEQSMSPDSQAFSCGWFDEDFEKLSQASDFTKTKFKDQEAIQSKIETILLTCLNGLMEICISYDIQVPANLTKAQSV